MEEDRLHSISPPRQTPATTLYELLGGESGVRALVERFYDLMDEREEFARLRQHHPADLAGSREKLFLFLSGWMGGPALYVQKYGHPRLRARHLPFAIGEADRDQWLGCLRQSLESLDVAPAARDLLLERLAPVADFMRNQPE